jgi:glycosidase
VLQLTAVGIPTLFYGEEVGRPGGDWPENRSDMPWGGRNLLPGAGKPRDEGLRTFYQRLIAIRRAHPALSRGLHQSLQKEGDLYAFLRRDPETHDVVVVAINRGAQPQQLTFTAPEEWGSAEVRELLGEGTPSRSGPQLQLQIPARAARILAIR